MVTTTSILVDGTVFRPLAKQISDNQSAQEKPKEKVEKNLDPDSIVSLVLMSSVIISDLEQSHNFSISNYAKRLSALSTPSVKFNPEIIFGNIKKMCEILKLEVVYNMENTTKNNGS